MRLFQTISLLLAGLFYAGCRQDSPPAPSATSLPRIVSLAPNLTESLCAIGAEDLLVGRTSACNYPPKIVDTVPVIGGFGHPSLELLAHVRPTLVLDVDLADESVAAQITAMGIRHQRIPCNAIDDIAPMLRELGKLTGCQTRANALAKEIATTLAQAQASGAGSDGAPLKRPSVYAEVWNDPLTTIGTGTFLADMIRLAGGRIIAESVKKPYFQIAPEQVVAENPDIILCLYMGPREGAAQAIKRRPGWQHINAVKNNCIFEGLDNDLLLRPGPRLLAGLNTIRTCIESASKQQGERPRKPQQREALAISEEQQQ